MTFIKRHHISGFRGILTPLELSFLKGGNITSMAIFGRNGFGKSSLTDRGSGCKTDRVDRLGSGRCRPNDFRIEEQPVALPMLK